MLYNKIAVEGDKENEILLPKNRLVKIHNNTPFIDYPYLDSNDELSGKAIYLDEGFDWVLGMSKTGSLVCVPLKKE